MQNSAKVLLQQRLDVEQEITPMATHCIQDWFDFGTVEGRANVGAFDGGLITSDAASRADQYGDQARLTTDPML
jgi:hypothetical protein